jgi:hypothetical protein
MEVLGFIGPWTDRSAHNRSVTQMRANRFTRLISFALADTVPEEGARTAVVCKERLHYPKRL